MEFVHAYIAGLLTLINPCVLPVLPIVLVSALNTSRMGPVALAAGMGLSFVVFGVLVTAFGSAIGLTADRLAQIGALVMMVFGIILLVPAFALRFETATAGLATSADQHMSQINQNNLRGQFVGGTLLGAVWSPCIGPTLGGAIALASQGKNLWYASFIMTSFALGLATLIIGLGLGARETLAKRANTLKILAKKSKPILGAAFLCVGVMLYFKLHHALEASLLKIMPVWLLDLSVKY